ncbi:MAG: hypothetical protein J6R04_04575, partial [Clostridia bacterium]|nr:hypothetical protein [Clostridia bacterium]
DWKATGKYGYEADPTTYSDVNTNLINTDPLSAAYSAIVAQLKVCQAAANTANNTFDAFQLNSIYGSAEDAAQKVFGTGTSKVKYENVTDAQLLAALTASMCEAGGVQYNPYLTDVTKVMDISKIVNGKTTTGINEYELYEKMISKAYDLLWDKYKVTANNIAATMLKDYISLVYEATLNTVAKDGQIGSTPLNPSAIADLAKAMTNEVGGVVMGEKTEAGDLTDGFVAAYLNGTADGKLAGTFYEKLGKNFNATKFVDYYANNGKAVKITTVAGGNMTYGTYLANPLASLKANQADIQQRLTGSMLSVSLKINSASKDEMKASNVPVEKAFDSFLKEGIANLDEIIARFTIEDYKAKTYNDMIVKTSKIVDYYGKNDAAVAAMQQYLMGVNDAKAFGGTITYTAANVTTVKNWTFGKNGLEDTLTNAQLLTNVSAVTVNPYATSNGVETVKVAEAAQKQINDAAAAATAVIENVAIKVNFLNYLEAARMEWLNIYRQYTAKVESLAPQNFELKLRMSMLSSEVDDTITVIKYYAEQDGIELKNYKANYLEILSMIGAQTNPHLALLQGKTIDEVLADTTNALGAKTFKDSAAKVLSTYELVVNSSKTESWVVTVAGTMNSAGVVEIDPLTHVGTAVVDLDKLANENTEIKTVAGSTTTTRKLYN